MVVVESKIIAIIIVFGILVVGGASYGLFQILKKDDVVEPEIFPELKSPVAMIEASATRIIQNETIVFNSSKSFDPDGEITTYIWDFGDGYKNTTNSTNVSHQYEKLSSDGKPYNVTLTVIDDHSQDNTTSINITVIPMQYKDKKEFLLLSLDIPLAKHQENVSFEKQPFDANFTLNLSLTGGSLQRDPSAILSVEITDPENLLIYTDDYNITGSKDENIYLPVGDFSKTGEYHISIAIKKGTIYVDYTLMINYQ